MRKLVQLFAAAAGAVTVTALVMAPAMADPINPNTGASVTPRACDVVGVGSNTIEFVDDQLSVNYNKTLLATIAKKGQTQATSCAKQAKPFFYSWDALQNAAATTAGTIKFKTGCAAEPRPNGSSAGIAALATNLGGTTGGHPCLDFARSSRPPAATDPTTVSFIALAQDNVTYASISKGSNAPTNLTITDLHNIYTCSATTWNQVGGKSTATIHPVLPQPHSGTLAFFEAAINVTTPGPCVTQPANLEENEGINSIFTNASAANEIIPFSAGKWASQEYHSPACFFKTCPTDKSGVFIKCVKPAKGQNAFGCNVNGVLKLNDVNGTDPLKGKSLNPPASTTKGGFTNTLVRTLFHVVRGTKSIPSYLAPFFGPTGFFCSKGEESTIEAYGFEPAHIKGFPSCGSITAG
jgi:ABC-type phosphate transport system substrate-binding protein